MIVLEALPPTQFYIVFLSFVTVSVTMLNNLSDNGVPALPQVFPVLLALTTSLASVQIVVGLLAHLPPLAADKGQVLLHMAVVVVATLVFWKWTTLKTGSVPKLTSSAER